ncbi:MAG: hydrogenase accessory protein HypB, partial [Treponema sp.]
DIDSDVDAKTVEEAGAKTIQLHTGGMCHLDAAMTRQGLDALGTDGLDLVVLENIGNLICTADYDTGAAKNAMILSVPEGDDKPLKYPHMFEIVDVLLVNKIDAMSFFDFDMKKLEERVKALNPNITVLPVSAKTGEGINAWAAWLEQAVSEWKKKS